MELFRKEMDKSILEGLKNKIARFLQAKGLNGDFFKTNMDNGLRVYVENLEERGIKAKMGFKHPEPNIPAEIIIDKQFIDFDNNNNPIGLDKNIEKLIKSQLGHELIHAGSFYDGFTGIKSNKNNTGLNEGLTQMITEKIFGYIVSPNSDGYKDYKKIAKILDNTFGEKVILDSYFNHTKELEEQCNKIKSFPIFLSIN